jgi:hypothetical protein
MASKRRRVAEKAAAADMLLKSLHVGTISMKGLADIMVGCPQFEDTTAKQIRKDLGELNQRAFRQIARQVQLPLSSGGELTWTYARPAELMRTVMEQSPGLQDAYAAAWARSPPSPKSPWRLIIGFDEFTPGNKLNLEHSRKTMVLSFSFIELGGEALSLGTAWFSPVVVRSTVINSVLRAVSPKVAQL